MPVLHLINAVDSLLPVAWASLLLKTFDKMVSRVDSLSREYIHTVFHETEWIKWMDFVRKQYFTS